MSGKAPTFTNPIPCSHLARYRRRHGVRGYRSLQSSLLTSPNGKVGFLRDAVSQMPRCSSRSAGRGRLYFCLVCSKVLQALLHTPPLRSYFLSGRHGRESCRRSPTSCLCCDIAAIFAAAFSSDRTPWSPPRFLYSW